MSLSLEGKVTRFACFSRIIVILLQVLFNLLIDDHKALVFNPPIDPTRHVTADKTVMKLFGGFRRWDSIYFLHIAEYGYAYDNSLAFFPFFPLLVRLVAMTFFFPLQYLMSVSCVYILAAVLVNFIFFVFAARALYKLSLKTLKDDTLAYKAALFFCINPASIFMSVAYSETVFAFFAFKAMNKYVSKSYLQSVLYTALCSFTRSNGLLCTGFMLYGKLKELILQLLTVQSLDMPDRMSSLSASVAIAWIILCPTFLYTIVCIAPFVLYQIYAYLLFCNKAYSPKVPVNVEWYGQEMEYVTAGIHRPAWCDLKLPASYSYIQSNHWEVGFLRYYEVKQTPNFLLALPVILLGLLAARHYFTTNRAYCLSLGLRNMDYAQKKKDQKPKIGFEAAEVFVFIVHLLALTAFGLIFMHIQVLTRFLLSSSPVIYWYVAMITTPKDHVIVETNPWNMAKNVHKHIAVETEVNSKSSLRSLLLDQYCNVFGNDWKTNLVLGYFLIYFIVGIALHVNFLPWT